MLSSFLLLLLLLLSRQSCSSLPPLRPVNAAAPSFEDYLSSSLSPKSTLPNASPRPLAIAMPKCNHYFSSISASLPPASAYARPLLFAEAMLCGAVSRSIAQTVMHPANTLKTIYQSGQSIPLDASVLKVLSRGAGAQFLLSIPHGAMNFAVLESTRSLMNSVKAAAGFTSDGTNFALDFVSSAVATIVCSVVSTPQMMITDNIMAGNYPNLVQACSGLYGIHGVKGFYRGWFPGLAGKIPSYGLTWVLFQQLKEAQLRLYAREPTNFENTIMGCLSSTLTVSIMIPMDTVKTRLVTQNANGQYAGIVDCARQVFQKEGAKAFYRGLPPRLLSVVPMIGIQFGCYEFMKKFILKTNAELKKGGRACEGEECNSLEDVMLDVAADDSQPNPVPKGRGKRLSKLRIR